MPKCRKCEWLLFYPTRKILLFGYDHFLFGLEFRSVGRRVVVAVTRRFIGTIHSSLKRLEDCPLQEKEDAPEATVELFPQYTEGIKDLKVGADLILLTWFHLADRSVIKCVPRREYHLPQVGVFSTRSPDRPNPIGMHRVKIISISDTKFTVSALEALDGTPLVDIKPN
jgi:tRNA-Thr(GGU) m(6)t(6)A37 methyltransferase TsaA